MNALALTPWSWLPDDGAGTRESDPVISMVVHADRESAEKSSRRLRGAGFRCQVVERDLRAGSAKARVVIVVVRRGQTSQGRPTEKTK